MGEGTEAHPTDSVVWIVTEVAERGEELRPTGQLSSHGNGGN